MTTTVITPATELPITLAAAKDALHEDTADKDADITDWINGIAAYVMHYTGRALTYEGARVTLDEFPNREGGGDGAIRLDGPPVVSVQSVKYLDVDGTLQTLDPQDYLVDLVSEPAYVVPAPGKTWPTEYDRINAVTVDYTRGYSADATGIPAGITLYIKAKLREQFDPASRVERDTVQSSFIDHLLDPYVMYG